MLFQLSYPPFCLYSKPNHQVTCACHCFNQEQHNNVILMDNSIPVKRQAPCHCGLGALTRAYQPADEQGNHKPQGCQTDLACED